MRGFGSIIGSIVAGMSVTSAMEEAAMLDNIWLRSPAPNSGPPLAKVRNVQAYLGDREPQRGVKYYTGVESGIYYPDGLNGKRAVARRLRQIEAVEHNGYGSPWSGATLRAANGLVSA